MLDLETLTLGRAEKPRALFCEMKTPLEIALARLENERAPAPPSTPTGPPRPYRSRIMPDENGSWMPPARRGNPKGTLSDPDILAALAVAAPDPWITRPAPLPADFAACGLPVMEETEKKIPMSFLPPRFKTLKAGPRAGQAVEEKWMLRTLTRTVTYTAPGGQCLIYSATARLTKAGLVPPASVKVAGRSMARPELRAAFIRRWPAKAAELAGFLLMEDSK
jgi:hypothetical protein